MEATPEDSNSITAHSNSSDTLTSNGSQRTRAQDLGGAHIAGAGNGPPTWPFSSRSPPAMLVGLRAGVTLQRS